MTTQTWDPVTYQRDAGFVSALGAPVLDLLTPRAGERVLDVGCGDGTLTQRLVEVGCAVVAIDSSPAQIEAARKRGLDARVLDARTLDYVDAFDAVFSNAALHWMRDPDTVARGVARALVPGGRFVGEFGGHGNVASVVAAYAGALATRGLAVEACNPWYFPDEETYSAVLTRAGLVVETIELFARPTPLPGDVADWLHMMTQAFYAAVPRAEQPSLLADVRDRLRATAYRGDGKWELDYVRLRFRALKPLAR